jgi:hypothetical protein
LNDVVGRRGELAAERVLLTYRDLPEPLFRPGFLDGKWPGIDYYVELLGVPGRTPFFFVQVKATASDPGGRDSLTVDLRKEHVARLLGFPAPTYVLGVHEPSDRVFVRAVHAGRSGGFTTIPVTYELTPANLRVLHDEVAAFWSRPGAKPADSRFD